MVVSLGKYSRAVRRSTKGSHKGQKQVPICLHRSAVASRKNRPYISATRYDLFLHRLRIQPFTSFIIAGRYKAVVKRLLGFGSQILLTATVSLSTHLGIAKGVNSNPTSVRQPPHSNR
jgi:hypothetical protein